MSSSITWREFRKLAEAAHGSQAAPARIVKRDGRLDVENSHRGNDADLVIELTPEQIPTKNRPLKVVLNDIVIEGTEVKYGDVCEIADAIFWSMASVQKFLIPYYAGFEPLTVLMEKLDAKFKDPNVLAILHLPRSEPSGGGGGGGGGGLELQWAIRKASDRAGGATLFAAEARAPEGPLKLSAIL